MDELDKFQEGAEGLTPTPITEQPVEPPAAAEPAPQPQQQEQQAPAEQNPLASVSGIDNPIGQAMEQISLNVLDFVDNTFQGDQKSKEDISNERAGVRAEAEQKAQELKERIDADTGVLPEAVRAVAGGVAGAVEGTGETAELLGDTAKQVLGLNNGDETQNPFSDEYESADWDLGVTENKTAVGGFARGAITLLTAMRFVPGGQLAQGSRVGRVGIETARGAIADFFVGGEEGNLSNALEDGFTLFGNDVQLNNTFIQAISIDEDDNPYEARLKNMVEGGIFGVAVDGVGELIGAFRAGRKVREAGGTPEEAADAVVEYIQGNLNTGVLPKKPLKADDVYMEVTDGDLSRLADLPDAELTSLVQDYGVGQFTSMREIVKNLPPQRAMDAFGEAIYTKKLPNGTEIDWMARKVDPETIAGSTERADLDMSFLSPEAQARLGEITDARVAMAKELQGQNIIRIDWDLQSGIKSTDQLSADDLELAEVDYTRQLTEGEKPWEQLNEAQKQDWIEGMKKDGFFKSEDIEINLGNQGTRLYKQFGEVARQQKPGTIIQAQAADDGFGVKGTSKAQARRAESGIEGDESNIREKLYQRAGLSAPNDDGIMYGIVMSRPNGRKVLQPLDFTKPIQEQVDEALERSQQYGLNLGNTDFEEGFKPEGEFIQGGPGRAQRVQDQQNYGSTPQSNPMYEPSDAAARTSAHTPQDAARSQYRAEVFESISTPTGSPSVLTDAAYDLILSPRATQGATEDAIKSTRAVIARVASSIDVDKLASDLGQSHDVTVAKALNAVRDFVGQADELSTHDAMKLLDSVSFYDEYGELIPTRQGVVALKTLIKDTAFQLSEVSMNLMDGAASAADFVRQTEMLVPRLKALTRMHKVGSVHYGSGLNAFKIGAIGNASGPGKLMKDITDMDKQLDELVDLARKGDPKALEDFKNIANGLVASGGDPKKILSFWQLFRKVGGREALTTMYNSFLSGPVTHVRNMMGNSMSVTLRPIAMALGHGMSGNFGKAGSALGSFHSFHDSVWEALKVGGQAIKTGMPINEGQKFASLTKQTAADLDTLRKSASTTSEKGAAFFLTKVHDLVNNPWATLPSRLLTASDDAFKTLTARMEMKRQVFEESLDPKSAGFGFDEKRYAQLIEKKTGVNGEIVDKKILDIAKENTFQQELHGTMKRIADLADSDPIFKYFMPFVRTPHNLMVYAGTHTPLINRFMDEYKAVMKGSDENAKAIMRGREAIGWMTTISAVSLALNGTITGNGPVDPQKRKLWLKTNQPQSIKIAGKWVSYSSVEPLNVIFAAATDMVKIAQAGDNAAYDRNVGQLAYTIAQATYNRSYFQGLQSAVSFMNPEELAKGKVLPREFAKLVNTFIPLSGARRQLARAMAPGMYEYRNELDRALGSALPGYNNAVGIQKTDIFTGEKLDTDQTNPWNWILPFKITDVNDDMVLKTLSEKGVDFNTVMKSANGIELTAEDKVAIDELTADQDIHKKLEKLFKADWWKEDYAEWEQRKARGDSSDIRDARWYERTVAIIQKARTAAVKQYRMTNEDFSARYKAAKANDYNAGRGNYEALVELNQK